MYQVLRIMGKFKKKLLTAQRGFSPLFVLLPIALVFVVTVLLVQQGKLGQFLNQPAPTPASLETATAPQLDDEACNDQYNADCYIGDDEGDEVKAEDLIGPD